MPKQKLDISAQELKPRITFREVGLPPTAAVSIGPFRKAQHGSPTVVQQAGAWNYSLMFLKRLLR